MYLNTKKKIIEIIKNAIYDLWDLCKTKKIDSKMLFILLSDECMGGFEAQTPPKYKF